MTSATAMDFLGGRARLYPGDCLQVMASLAPDSFHACVTDPPYHFTSIIKRWSKAGANDRTASGAMGRHSRGFMGRTWDGGDIAFRPETWQAVLRVLKPGAHLVAFGAPKNVHRLTCAIEDAGFEIRDQFLWLFGVGFPKNHDAKKAMGKATDTDLFREPLEHAAGKWEGWGTAAKPAYEPIIIARKPMIGTVQENLREHGTGAINIDACRVVADTCEMEGRSGKSTANNVWGAGIGHAGMWSPNKTGRWPANILHDGSDEVVAAFPAQAGALAPVRRRNADKFRNTYGAFAGDIDEGASTFRGDTGSAARFFYCTKATEGERVFRCLECGAHQVGKPKCGHSKFASHPTVKPIDLNRYLTRLVSPPDGLILDPFAGTGTTAQAAIAEGMRAVLIEAEAEYQADICRRLEALQVVPAEAAE